MSPNREGKAVVPGRGGYDVEFVEVTGPPDSMMPMPPAKSRGKLIPLGTGEGVPEGVPQRQAPGVVSRKQWPLVPTDAEVAGLPRLARVAFLDRCALRVKPVRDSGVATAADAARVIFEAATIDSPLTAQLRCIRRDFVRLKRLAKKENWTDDTPVPPEVFGPMWPQGVAPYWAVEPPVPPTTTQEPVGG
jgi:hypothetical protein